MTSAIYGTAGLIGTVGLFTLSTIALGKVTKDAIIHIANKFLNAPQDEKKEGDLNSNVENISKKTAYIKAGGYIGGALVTFTALGSAAVFLNTFLGAFYRCR